LLLKFSTIHLEIIQLQKKIKKLGFFFPLGDLGTWIEPSSPPPPRAPRPKRKKKKGVPSPPLFSSHKDAQKKKKKKKKKKYSGGCCFTLAMGCTGISQGGVTPVHCVSFCLSGYVVSLSLDSKP
jgi:hypothetical protein